MSPKIPIWIDIFEFIFDLFYMTPKYCGSYINQTVSNFWSEQVLRYGLYLGAAFQILCILAVIFDISPSKNSSNPTDSNNSAGESSSDEADSEDEDHSNQQRNRRRIERKKRR